MHAILQPVARKSRRLRRRIIGELAKRHMLLCRKRNCGVRQTGPAPLYGRHAAQIPSEMAIHVTLTEYSPWVDGMSNSNEKPLPPPPPPPAAAAVAASTAHSELIRTVSSTDNEENGGFGMPYAIAVCVREKSNKVHVLSRQKTLPSRKTCRI